MKKITIISGKGGTGKTSLAGSFGALACGRAVLVDGDVDAANLSLIMKPKRLEEHDFIASSVAYIEQESCTSCDLCRQLCRFEAISSNYVVNPLACEGCAFCHYICPVEAITMQERISGKRYLSETPYGFLVHARLGIAEENSGKLVTMVRKVGEELAHRQGCDYLIIDGPPGIGCPVIASLSGVDVALIVTEPTVSGVHDLERVVAVCNHFNVPARVCINRSDLEAEQAERIRSYCKQEKLPLIGEIPFDPLFIKAMIAGQPVVEFSESLLAKAVVDLWDRLIDSVN